MAAHLRAIPESDGIDSALKFLWEKFSDFERERLKWQQDREKLSENLSVLQKEKEIQEQLHRDLLKRIKMLEFALIEERKGGSRPTGNIEKLAASMQTPNAVDGSSSTHPSLQKSTSVVQKEIRPILKTVDSIREAKTETRQQQPIQSHTESAMLNKEFKFKDLDQSQPQSQPQPQPQPQSQQQLQSQPSGLPTTQLSERDSFRPSKLKLKLCSHLGGVQSIAFHPTEPVLVSGSEDCTVKIWNLKKMSQFAQEKRTADVEPVRTYRGHTKSVLAVETLPAECVLDEAPEGTIGLCASAGRCGSIILWAIPSTAENAHPYTYEEQISFKVDSIVAHLDAIWDLTSHPTTDLLFSSSADGTVRLWSVSPSLTLKNSFLCTINHVPAFAGGHTAGGSFVPTTVTAVSSNLNTCAVGYSCPLIVQYDIETGQSITKFVLSSADFISMNNGCHDSQVNQVVSHPTLPLLVAAHDDCYIRYYDIRAGKCVQSVLAHQAAVSSVSIDPSGLYLVSGGHDGSLRFWSLIDRTCLYEQTAHRSKYDEAVHSVVYHNNRGFLASAGADNLVKIFQ